MGSNEKLQNFVIPKIAKCSSYFDVLINDDLTSSLLLVSREDLPGPGGGAQHVPRPAVAQLAGAETHHDLKTPHSSSRPSWFYSVSPGESCKSLALFHLKTKNSSGPVIVLVESDVT